MELSALGLTATGYSFATSKLRNTYNYVVQSFLQIGLGDDERSENHRPPWKRIIYHHFEELNLDNGENLRKVAMSRDSVPHTALPPSATRCVYTTYGCSREQWDPKQPNATISMLNESATRVTRPQSENGDAQWECLDMRMCCFRCIMFYCSGRYVGENVGSCFSDGAFWMT